MEQKKVIPIFQLGHKPSKGYENVPMVEDVTSNPEHRKMLRAMTTGGPMGRSMSAAPGTPKGRLQYLRRLQEGHV